MMQLNKDIVSIFRKNNNDWVEMIREAEESGTGLDMSQIVSKNVERFEDINTAFNQWAERNKKKGIWR